MIGPAPNSSELDISLPGEPTIRLQGKLAAIVRYLVAHRVELDRMTIGRLLLEWRPGKVDSQLTRFGRESLPMGS